MSARLFAATLLLVLASCQPAAPVSSAPVAPDAEDRHVLAFAQAACGGCHAVEDYALSPLAEAPEWPLIVNREGLTQQTLSSWLRDAHNYPEEMDFDLDMPQVEELAAYMLTLRREGYEPPIQ